MRLHGRATQPRVQAKQPKEAGKPRPEASASWDSADLGSHILGCLCSCFFETTIGSGDVHADHSTRPAANPTCFTTPCSLLNSSAALSVAFTPLPPHCGQATSPSPLHATHWQPTGMTGPRPAAARRLRSRNSSCSALNFDRSSSLTKEPGGGAGCPGVAVGCAARSHGGMALSRCALMGWEEACQVKANGNKSVAQHRHRAAGPAPAAATTSTAAMSSPLHTCRSSASLLSGLMMGCAGPQTGRTTLQLPAGAAACTIICSDDLR